MLWQLIVLFFMALYSIQIRCHYVVPEYPAFQPWSYGYDVEDNYGNNQWKHEESHNPHEVKGSYGYKDNNGVYREVVYVADKDGFRANIKTNEPGSAQKDPAAVKMDSYHPNQNPIYSIKQANPIYSSPNYYNMKKRA